MWQHGSLNVTEYRDGQPFDQQIFFHNSTFLVQVPPEYADFTDKVHRSNHQRHTMPWGSSLTKRHVEECDHFFFGRGMAALTVIIVVVSLKTLVSGFTTLTLVNHLTVQHVLTLVKANTAAQEINLVPA